MNRKIIIDRGTRGEVCLTALVATALGAMISIVGFNWNFLNTLGFPAALHAALLPALLSALLSAGLLLPIVLAVQKRKKTP